MPGDAFEYTTYAVLGASASTLITGGVGAAKAWAVGIAVGGLVVLLLRQQVPWIRTVLFHYGLLLSALAAVLVTLSAYMHAYREGRNAGAVAWRSCFPIDTVIADTGRTRRAGHARRCTKPVRPVDSLAYCARLGDRIVLRQIRAAPRPDTQLIVVPRDDLKRLRFTPRPDTGRTD